jgi:hypothetical protein
MAGRSIAIASMTQRRHRDSLRSRWATDG